MSPPRIEQHLNAATRAEIVARARRLCASAAAARERSARIVSESAELLVIAEQLRDDIQHRRPDAWRGEQSHSDSPSTYPQVVHAG